MSLNMKFLNQTLLLSLIASECIVAGGDIVPVKEAVTLPATPKSFTIFNHVTANGEIRPRYEFVDTDNTKSDAKALTNRLTLGISADLLNVEGLSTHLEAMNVSGTGDYNSLSNGDTDYNVVADPSQTRVTQAYIDYKASDTLLRAGRQGVNLDNQRFIGTVNWRQMPQTYDAITIKNHSIDGLSLMASYIWQVNRIFDKDSANKLLSNRGDQFDTSSLLLHANYKVMDGLALTGYGYMLEDIHDTYGIALHGKVPVVSSKLSYRAEYAIQSDPTFTDTLPNKTADAEYYNIEGTLNMSGILVGAKYEVLGAGNDGNGAFSTPLATLHAHNGWADMFLGTPADGLVDISGMVGYKAKGFGTAKLLYHDFSSDTGSTDYGTEIDALYVNKISFVKGLSGLLKAGFYSADDFKDDTTKYWAMLSYKF